MLSHWKGPTQDSALGEEQNVGLKPGMEMQRNKICSIEDEPQEDLEMRATIAISLFCICLMPVCEGGNGMHEQVTVSLLASKDMGRTGSQWTFPCVSAQNFWVRLLMLQVTGPKWIMDSKLF